MHFLAISLLAILAGTLLLIKIKKDQLGRFFSWIAWFFVVVGFLLFAGFIAGGVCKLSHCCKTGNTECGSGMMKENPHMMNNELCCPPEKANGFCGPSTKSCGPRPACMHQDSTMKACMKRTMGDTAKMCCPKPK